MKTKTIKLPLTKDERNVLRQHRFTLKDIMNMEPDFLSSIFNTAEDRARALIALAEFQTIPTVGPRMAQSLVDLGYYSINELKGKDGAALVNDLEQLYGYWEDPCVEDVFRLIVHYAEHGDQEKRWWHFTEERKQYRSMHGYPTTRPAKAWNEVK